MFCIGFTDRVHPCDPSSSSAFRLLHCPPGRDGASRRPRRVQRRNPDVPPAAPRAGTSRRNGRTQRLTVRNLITPSRSTTPSSQATKNVQYQGRLAPPCSGGLSPP